jgi:L-methionine (R)-S-oxide reductase
MSDTQAILKQLDALLEARATDPDWLRQVCALLQRERPHYNWVGFYFLEGNELVVGPYVGAPTPHTRIPLDQGICGAAVRERKSIIVPDVGQDPRYLACSLETKSEIVVPIEAEGRILGEIDIDSHQLNAFQADDHTLLQAIARRLAPVLAQQFAARA